MSLRLVYRGATNLPVEVEGLTPDWACDKTLAEVERLEIFHGNRRIPLAEMFSVTGDPSDKQVELAGNLSGVHWIGANMASGCIRIHGPAGRHVGSEMSGGAILADGDVGDWVGAEMRKGLIHVRGNAAHLAGAAYRGSAKGMSGGAILVEGNAGHEVGHTMRRGLIAVVGGAGDLVGFNMLAGTVLVFGECGIRAGAGMRRGTIGQLGPRRGALLPGFRYSCRVEPVFLRMILRSLRSFGLAIDESLARKPVDLYHGDLLEMGRGEVLLPTAA